MNQSHQCSLFKHILYTQSPSSLSHTLFITQHKYSYTELHGPGQEGSFLSRQRWVQPGQAVWVWVGRTKLLADAQASDWLQDEPVALCVMYSMLSLVRCCSQGNRRGFRLSSQGRPTCCPLWYSGGHSVVLWQSFGWCIIQSNRVAKQHNSY